MTKLNNPSGCMHLRKRKNTSRNIVGDIISALAGIFLWITR